MSVATIGVDWRARAVCRPFPNEWWELVGRSLTADNEFAIGICEACPVRTDCAADVRDDDNGVIRAGIALRSSRIAEAVRLDALAGAL